MPTYQRFEDLPAWNAATEVAVETFRLTEAASFRFKGDLVNQLRRAALSIANNIAEGFERGSTAELISFLYIARGSAGEVRSMLRFALRLGEMPDEAPRIKALIAHCESVSRQIRGWLDALQNSDIAGQRHLNDKTRRVYEEDRKAADFQTRLAAYRAAMEQQLRDGTFHTPDAEPLPSLFPAKPAAAPPSVAPEPKSAAPAAPSPPAAASGMPKTSAPAAAPSCPLCGRTMVLRPSRSGANFWGCPAYPQCKGHRNAT